MAGTVTEGTEETEVATPMTNDVAVVATDGMDFLFRQKVASQYRVSGLYKSRLKFCIFLHFVLFLAMCTKVTEDILDRLDIFILELEELYIPKPLIWEWIWLSSFVFIFPGLKGIKRNKVTSVTTYAIGIFLFGVCPVIGAGIYYFKEMWHYVQTRDSTDVEKWQGYPIALLWYVFLTLCFQVHIFSLYFAVRLIRTWKLKAKKSN
ncbi:LOW QUALITY PROTEIN: protein jagunal-like [Centruroides vittatus]|uniref:LOW QUALITY PROTEIN: protein jagunal-like n=1 Tax=Centruroides vittatus TaxID=120091 RepID=UPI00350E9764